MSSKPFSAYPRHQLAAVERLYWLTVNWFEFGREPATNYWNNVSNFLDEYSE